MTDPNNTGLRKINRALISVSDKTGIVEFARDLQQLGVEIISTGGTAKTLRDAGLKVRDVSDITGFPEMMDGRVKTLHPRIHGGLLAKRDNEEHMAAMHRHDIEPLDMVVVNLYPFEETVEREDVTLEEAVEQIDIGGPAMIRSAAKNWHDVAVVTTPDLYEYVLVEMRDTDGCLTLDMRSQLAKLAFMRTALYDSAVFSFLRGRIEPDGLAHWNLYPPVPTLIGTMQLYMELFSSAMRDQHPEFVETATGEISDVEDKIELVLQQETTLRYGENPHQTAGLYTIEGEPEFGVAQAKLLSGKEMSFNNYVDADAAWQLVTDFDELACAIIKHTNPAGVATGSSVEESYRSALATDPVSAFGGIIAFNRRVDLACALAITEIFTEVVIAPDYDDDAIKALGTKKNLRVLRMDSTRRLEGPEYKQISGGMLVQSRDIHRLTRDDIKVVTRRSSTDAEIIALLFAWTVCKHTKSNAIVYAREGQTVGVGAGQMSRVDSVRLGAMRALLPLRGTVLASDAFFPFRDGIDEAVKHGITAVIQPGGSVRDEEVIAAADEHGVAMVFTGVRHFKH